MTHQCLSTAPRLTSRRCVGITAAIACMGLSVHARASDQDRQSLVGTWHLVSYLDTPDTGVPVQAFGAHPIGYFVFTADGHASISIMRNPPNGALQAKDPDPDVRIPDWYCSYFGTYSVDLKQGLYIVHVIGSNEPGYVGTDQSRHFSIDGDRMVISETYMERQSSCEGGARAHPEFADYSAISMNRVM
jgi:Lipocalin-like domain